MRGTTGGKSGWTEGEAGYTMVGNHHPQRQKSASAGDGKRKKEYDKFSDSIALLDYCFTFHARHAGGFGYYVPGVPVYYAEGAPSIGGSAPLAPLEEGLHVPAHSALAAADDAGRCPPERYMVDEPFTAA